jgi:hypothetical protein
MTLLTDVAKIQSAWSLLEDLYTATEHLTDMSEDRRTSHAAKSVIATWNECRQKPGLEYMEKPPFVSHLEDLLAQDERNLASEASRKENQMDTTMDLGQGKAGEDDLQPFGFEFADIDWAFWDSIR